LYLDWPEAPHEEGVFSIGVKYLDGKLEQNTFLDFKLSISKQNTDGEFSDVFRNFESKDGRVFVARRRQSLPIGPISKEKTFQCLFLYVQGIHMF